MTTRKKYSKEFKLDAVSLVTDQGYSRVEAARKKIFLVFPLRVEVRPEATFIQEHAHVLTNPGYRRQRD